MTAPHTADLDHAIAAALNHWLPEHADAVQFNLYSGTPADAPAAYQAVATRYKDGVATDFYGVAETPIDALSLAMDMLHAGRDAR